MRVFNYDGGFGRHLLLGEWSDIQLGGTLEVQVPQYPVLVIMCLPFFCFKSDYSISFSNNISSNVPHNGQRVG